MGQIERVFENLAINAVQSMPDGGTLCITAENRTIQEGTNCPLAPGRYVEITFTDKGSGIPNENLPRIFDPYFTTRRNGSGLGLATAYAVVRKHDGLITVESVEGRGSRFIVCMPATSSEATRSDEVWQPADHDGRRVLLMDDEEVVRTTVDMMLTDLGFEVVTAAEGGAAVEAYRNALEGEAPFDLVILDLSVPHGLGGIPTLQRLKEIRPDVRAIVASGYSTDSVLADCESYGFSVRLAKPFRIADLDRELQRVLAQRVSPT